VTDRDTEAGGEVDGEERGKGTGWEEEEEEEGEGEKTLPGVLTRRRGARK